MGVVNCQHSIVDLPLAAEMAVMLNVLGGVSVVPVVLVDAIAVQRWRERMYEDNRRMKVRLQSMANTEVEAGKWSGSGWFGPVAERVPYPRVHRPSAVYYLKPFSPQYLATSTPHSRQLDIISTFILPYLR